MSTVRTVPRYVLPDAHLRPLGTENYKNSVLNSSTAQRCDISSEAMFKCAVVVLQLKSILEVGSKERSSIEDPFK
jgi:hypothetical protein